MALSCCPGLTHNNSVCWSQNMVLHLSFSHPELNEILENIFSCCIFIEEQVACRLTSLESMVMRTWQVSWKGMMDFFGDKKPCIEVDRVDFAGSKTKGRDEHSENGGRIF